MATDRQIAANRLNGSKSRGPVTDEGKARSRRNAITHGLAGEGLVVAEAMADAFDDRRDRWAREIRPQGDGANWALDRGVTASIQIEQCEAAYHGLVVEQTARARLCWDGDRRVEAATMMTKLAKAPMLITCQLEAAKQGAEAMIAVWSRLGEANRANGVWSDTEASTALDLLGVPAGLRAGRTRLDAPGGVDPAGHRRGMVIDECARLAGRIEEALDELDAIARANAERSAMVVLSPAASRLHRYERDAWRRYRESMKAATAGSSAAEAPPEPAAAEEVAPANVELDENDRDRAIFEEILARRSRARTPEELAAVTAEAEVVIARVQARRAAESAVAVAEVAPSRPMNRKQRRAMAAQARRG
jgi:hypothetical protein